MKCLVTKLQGVVDNDKLYKLDETRFILPKGAKLNFVTNGCKARLLKGALNNNSTPMSIKQEYNLTSGIWISFTSLEDNTVLSLFNPSGIEQINTNNNIDFRLGIPDTCLFNHYSIEQMKSIKFDAMFKSFGFVPKLKMLGEGVNFLYTKNFSWENFDIKHLPLLDTVSFSTEESHAVSLFGKHIGLVNLNISATLAYGTMESLGEEMVKNGRMSGKMTVTCSQIDNGTTWKGNPTTYRQTLYYKFDPSLSGGYEITDTEPIE